MKGDFSIKADMAVLENTVLNNAYISISRGLITGVSADRPTGKVMEFPGSVALPGFIDLHTHGRVGLDTKDIDRELLAAYAQTGTTAFLPTYADSMESIEAWLEKMSDIPHFPGCSKILGAHVEGPFIDPENRGGIDEKVCLVPNRELLDSLLASRILRYMTISPFVEGALEAISYLSEQGVICIAGHSRGDELLFDQAVEAGLKGMCHWYNNNAPREQLMGEPGVHQPTLCDCALLHRDIFLEIVCDLQHVSSVFIRLAFAMKGAGRIAVITDSVSAAGLPEGIYEYHDGRKFEIKDGGVHEVSTGGRFGSCVTQPEEFANLVEHVGIGMPEAARMCSLTPAEIVRADETLGSIAVGKCADLVLLDRDTFEMREVFVDGLAVRAGGS